MRRFFLGAFGLILSLTFLHSQSLELPVTKVVLFTSGVGYFEHKGPVSGNGTLRLEFTPEQMNDIIKSLLVRDDSGKVAAVNYTSQDPLERALGSYRLDLSKNQGLAGLLDQVRGAEVQVTAPEKITGRILGLESKTRFTPDGARQDYQQLNLFSEGQIRGVELDRLGALKFTDPEIGSDLAKALALLLDSADTRKKGVDIKFEGNGSRTVSLGYVVEAPVWKPSYRLDLSGGKPFLQGWAVVENTTDQDWKSVSLSLMSGRPVSFRQDLYSPFYVDRPEVALSFSQALKPQSYTGGMGGPQAPAKSYAAPAAAPMASRGMVAESEDYFMKEESAPGEMVRAVPAQAAGTDAGELFQFTIKGPVNLDRRQSALMPIIATDIQGERVSIYNSKVHGTRPYAGAWLTNSSGLKLPAGPVTVLDAGAYAGDALLDNLGPGERRLISYAMDLSLMVSSQETQTVRTLGVKASRGVLTFARAVTFTRTYTVESKAAEDRVLIVEHPLDSGRTLLAPKLFEEKTPEAYRFRLSAPKNAQGTLVVQEELPRTETVSLYGFSSNSFLTYISSGEIPQNIRASLEKAKTLKAGVEEQNRQLQALQTQKSELEAEQRRIRDNLGSVGRDSAQGRRYLEKLMEAETKLETLATQMEGARTKSLEAQKAFEDHLGKMEF